MAPPRSVVSSVAVAAVLALGLGATAWRRPPDRNVSDKGQSISVFAAASTADVLGEIAAMYERRHGERVRLNFASSSTLARQIEAGAAADVIVSANTYWLDYLDDAGRLRGGSRRDLLSNQLVLIAPRDNRFRVAMAGGFDLAGAFAGRVAVGDPEHVPAGMYARQALEHLGWHVPLRPRLVPCQNARMALAMVELKEAAAGIVYATDARASDKVVVLGVFPEDSHGPIRYGVALCDGASARAGDFLDYLAGTEAAAVFRRHGFTPLVTTGEVHDAVRP